MLSDSYAYRVPRRFRHRVAQAWPCHSFLLTPPTEEVDFDMSLLFTDKTVARIRVISVVCILPGVVSGPMLTCLGLRWQTCMSDVNALFLCLWQTSPIDPSILSGSTRI